MISNKYNNYILVKKSSSPVKDQKEKLDKSIDKNLSNLNKNLKKKLMIIILRLNYQKIRH